MGSTLYNIYATNQIFINFYHPICSSSCVKKILFKLHLPIFEEHVTWDGLKERQRGQMKYYNQSKSSVHDKLHELHSHFPPIAQRTPSIITSSCWKSTISDVRPSCIDRKKGSVQNITCSVALASKNLYNYKTKEYVDVLTSQSSSMISTSKTIVFVL